MGGRLLGKRLFPCADQQVFVLLLADDNIRAFMSNYRSLLPNESVFPKAHYLEEHMVAFARQWRVGPGPSPST